MRRLELGLALTLGVVLGSALHLPKVWAQDQPRYGGNFEVTVIRPGVKVLLETNELFAGFSCTQEQCYVLTRTH